MRICVVASSYEGSDSVFQEHDEIPNPGRYVHPDHHVFEVREIRKHCEREDIDKIVAEKFDMYWNFMWGQLYDDVAGIDAARYLEESGVPFIGSPSAYMAMTKQDLHRAAEQHQTFHVPGNTAGIFPKIVKFADGMASLNMDENSVCHSQEQVDQKIAALTSIDSSRKVLVEDFIQGTETTAIVMEMGSEVVALPPMDWMFPEGTQPDKAWLSFKSKFEDLDRGDIYFRFVDDQLRAQKICDAAVAAFKALGLQGGGCWGRLDARVDNSSGVVYCLEMNHYPAVFFPTDSTTSDDIIIRKYPGGHEAFIDMIIYTKEYQIACSATMKRPHVPGKASQETDKSSQTALRAHESMAGGAVVSATHSTDPFREVNRDSSSESDLASSSGTASTHSNDVHGATNVHDASIVASFSDERPPVGDLKAHGMTIADVYDSCVNTYDEVQAKMAIRAWQIQYFGSYPYTGTVLDLACGTGGIGMLIQEAGSNAHIHGVDVSPLSLQTRQVQQYYMSTSVGLLQEQIMGAGVFDHIVCFGALHFLDGVAFNATLSRMFMLARKSVAFDVDDVSKEYNDAIVSHFGTGLTNHNNTVVYQRFGTPVGWKKVVEKEQSLFYSPSVKIDVRGIVVRFERDQST